MSNPGAVWACTSTASSGQTLFTTNHNSPSFLHCPAPQTTLLIMNFGARTQERLACDSKSVTLLHITYTSKSVTLLHLLCMDFLVRLVMVTPCKVLYSPSSFTECNSYRVGVHGGLGTRLTNKIGASSVD